MAFEFFSWINARRGSWLIIAVIGLIGASTLGVLALARGSTSLAEESQRSAHSGRLSIQSDASFHTLSEFVNRSPGERGEVTSLKGLSAMKFRIVKEGSSPKRPAQRALGKVFGPEPVIEELSRQNVTDLFSVPSDFAGTPVGSVDPVQTGTRSSSGFGAPASINPGGFGFASPIPSTPNASVGPDANQAPVAIGAVPEPATWMLLLIGFFGAGIALRKSRIGTGTWNNPVHL